MNTDRPRRIYRAWLAADAVTDPARRITLRHVGTDRIPRFPKAPEIAVRCQPGSGKARREAELGEPVMIHHDVALVRIADVLSGAKRRPPPDFRIAIRPQRPEIH